MAIVVEDGTGLNNSETYISVADFKTYWSERGQTITQPSGEIEQAMRRATEFLDLRWAPHVWGAGFTEDQALLFPNTQVQEYDALTPTPLPRDLVRAAAEYTYFALTNALDADIAVTDTGGGVKRLREKLGPIETETEYAEPGQGGSVTASSSRVTRGDKLMRNLLKIYGKGVYR